MSERRQLLDVGDRLVCVSLAVSQYHVGRDSVLSIGIHQLPGPMGFYLVANITFEDDRADVIVPLHMASTFEALNP